MKTTKLFLSAVLFSILITSCSKKPVAEFSWTPISPKAGETVTFINNSTNAKKYDWNFGNGSISKEKEPYTVYLEGLFTVELTVHNGNKSDVKTQTITVTP